MTSLQERHKQVYDLWVATAKPDRRDIAFFTHNYIRQTHPDHHVTRTNPARANLLAYAAAGHATCTEEYSNPDIIDTIRSYIPTNRPFDHQEGSVVDQVLFGRWTYTWSSTTFTLYSITSHEPGVAPIEYLFILTPKLSSPSLHHPKTDALLLAAGTWTNTLHEEIYVWDDNGWVKDSALFQSIQQSSWDDIILPVSTKDSLISDTIGFFDSREIYQSLYLSFKRGIILHGVPGNGKTATIKALINSLAKKDIPSLYVKQFDSCRGSKWSIKKIFARAREMAPCLLIFEDLDSLVEDKLRSYFLNEVDGLESNEGILMIGSTNHLSRLDPAIAKRPSRFDRKYLFELPDLATRVQYARYWRRKLEGKEAGKGFEEGLCQLIGVLTEGFSFAYIKELFVSTLLAIVRGQVQTAEEEDDESGSGKDVVVVEKEEEGKRVFKDVETPEEFKENIFWKVLKVQARILWEQMESADEVEKEKVKTGVVGLRKPPVIKPE
ncbi:P-loop containing nucleoside triphosphate hydrolase protein [Podospora fimiseda]|uniref:P-loop containing nucleoside triphosphate hydrolase protein n=1 Tax=Podospora fimiseda TaxID=252190 RepID=A0AAN7H1X9_9PEZI|nr:P-loop containing nucleoside triphosphate hydrolase protein [Podospora fimiseda]